MAPTTFKIGDKSPEETALYLSDFCAETFPDAVKLLTVNYLDFSPTGFYVKDIGILQEFLGSRLADLKFTYNLECVHTEAYAIVLPANNPDDRTVLGKLLGDLKTLHNVGHTYHNVSTPNLTLALYNEDEDAEAALKNSSLSWMPFETLTVSDFHLLGKTKDGERVILA